MAKNKKASDKCLFKYSTPYGYNPSDVDKKIEKYENTIDEMRELNRRILEEKAETDKRSEKLETEMRQLQLQISMTSDHL